MIIKYNPQGFEYTLTRSQQGATLIERGSKSIVVDSPINEIAARWDLWTKRGEYIQDAFDNLNADEREFLMTGITAEEWDDLFSDPQGDN